MTLKRLPVTAILSTCLFLIGLSAAAIAPYRAIAAIDTLGMFNALYALIVTLSSVGTAVASLVMGYFSDRVRDRRFLRRSRAEQITRLFLLPRASSALRVRASWPLAVFRVSESRLKHLYRIKLARTAA